MRSVLTALIWSNPERLRIASMSTGFPHHEAMMISGSASMTWAADTFGRPHLFHGITRKNVVPPATSMSSLTHWIPEIMGSSHSSK